MPPGDGRHGFEHHRAVAVAPREEGVGHPAQRLGEGQRGAVGEVGGRAVAEEVGGWNGVHGWGSFPADIGPAARGGSAKRRRMGAGRALPRRQRWREAAPLHGAVRWAEAGTAVALALRALALARQPWIEDRINQLAAHIRTATFHPRRMLVGDILGIHGIGQHRLLPRAICQPIGPGILCKSSAHPLNQVNIDFRIV
jgi:hypothetical protein